nr:ABC transporter ATP-binding protein [uncultured Fournierella sp.]
MIQVEHLTKRYGSHLAVDDISFEVEEGIVYGLLGPNGAGKSTTMNILTGYLSATSGTVSIDGHDILEEASAAKACVGYLPEQPPLYVDMTPREYLMFVAELKKVKQADRAAQVEQAMDRTGLAEMEHRLIKNLSKGYRQRVGLAAALLGSPKVIILDEPTVGLDPAQVIEIRSLIKELGKDHTVILSSHILSEVSTLCDKVLIIAKGKLVAQGTPEELAQRLTAGSSLNITALGEADAVMNALLTVPGVSEVQITGQQNGETSATVQVPQGEDLRAAVSAALAAAGCPVLGLTTASMSLEDVFLQLTAQAGDEEAQEVLENQEEATLRPEDLDFVQNAVESGESGEEPWLEDSEQPDEEELRQENASAQAEEEEADEK